MPYDASYIRLDRPALIDLRAAADARDALEKALGLPMSNVSTDVAGNGETTVFRIGPDQWLVRAPAEEENNLLAALEHAARGRHAAVTCVSDAYSVFRLWGVDAREVLAQGVAIDVHPKIFPSGRATRCGFGKTSAILHCVDEVPAYDVYVDVTFDRYIERWLETAIG